MKFKDISIQDFKKELQDSALLIDIRDKDSYNRSNISKSKNYNSEDIMNLAKQDKKDTKIDDFIHLEFKHFSNSDNLRSIGSCIDGLKVSQRKILFSCFKRKL